VILVVGRPGLDEHGRLAGSAGLIAQAAAEAGVRVELVGSVGDDPDGDAVALALGRTGVGHAALLRDPAGATPRVGGSDGPLPRLDAEDLQLGLSYLTECRVLVLAEPLDEAARRTAAEAAAYHGAALVAVVGQGTGTGGQAVRGLPQSATVLEMPEADDGAFAALVGQYAAQLDAGQPPADAWHAALAGATWEIVEE
jgi:hypothetical protein